MAIYLVQHGQCLSKQEDPERPLSPAGQAEVENIAKLTRQHNLPVSTIKHSGKTRARQTAAIFSQLLPAVKAIEFIEGINPMDDVIAFSQQLHANENMMFIGHLPFMEKLVSYLLTGQTDPVTVKFQNGGIVCLDQFSGTSNWYVKWMLMPELSA